ncbi:MAG: Guanylate kinase [Firmicutes bacterium ADurb.Bin193]|nr:MAG: Guanylate kinase [Firmicutes bacterium ADurb.Bin193]
MRTTDSRGVLMVVSGPAGVGKGTICDEVARMMPDVFLSVSATSRPPRKGEIDGVHYFFKTTSEFEEMIKNGELLEYNRYVNGNYYGTPAAPCDEHIKNGDSVILEIDVEGGRQVKQKRPRTVMVFVVPPTFCELERRLRGRKTETEEDILSRLERAKVEFNLASDYDYIVVNDTVENAAEKIKAIIEAEKCKTLRCLDFICRHITDE